MPKVTRTLSAIVAICVVLGGILVPVLLSGDSYDLSRTRYLLQMILFGAAVFFALIDAAVLLFWLLNSRNR